MLREFWAFWAEEEALLTSSRMYLMLSSFLFLARVLSWREEALFSFMRKDFDELSCLFRLRHRFSRRTDLVFFLL